MAEKDKDSTFMSVARSLFDPTSAKAYKKAVKKNEDKKPDNPDMYEARKTRLKKIRDSFIGKD